MTSRCWRPSRTTSLDWVYLDSSHAYQHTVEELALLRRKVRPGGVIAGDDWQPDPSHPHHGVHRAVMELVSSGSCEVLYADAGDQQWAIRLPAAAIDPTPRWGAARARR